MILGFVFILYNIIAHTNIQFNTVKMKHVKVCYGMPESAFIKDILYVCMHCRFVEKN